MIVTLLFFARYRDIAQADQRLISIAAGATVGDVESILKQQDAAWNTALSVGRYAINAEFCDRSATLTDGDELALMPPVSGGSMSGVRAP